MGLTPQPHPAPEIPTVPFSPRPTPQKPVMPAELIDGGALALMHRDLQARLLEAFPAKQFQHDAVPIRLTPDEWRRLTRRTPFVGLGWVKMTPKTGAEQQRPRIWSGHAHWQLFLVVQNNQGPEAQILGDTLGVGLMGMLSVATAALQGHSIGGVGGAQIGEGGQIYSEAMLDASYAQAALSITVPFDVVDVAGFDRLNDFLRLGQRWPGLPDLVSDVRDGRPKPHRDDERKTA